MLGVFAEFETNLRRERQLEGIARAKAGGRVKGRPAGDVMAVIRPPLMLKGLRQKGKSMLAGLNRMQQSEREGTCAN